MTTTQIRQLTWSNVHALRHNVPDEGAWIFGATQAVFQGDVQQCYAAVTDARARAADEGGARSGHYPALHAVNRKLNDALTAIGAGEEPNPKYVRVTH